MYILLVAIAIAFIFVIIGKIAAYRLDKDASPNLDKSGGRRVDTAASIIAAIIIVGGVIIFQLLPPPSVRCVPGTIKISGSLARLLPDIATDYQNTCPGSHIQVTRGISTDDLKAAEEGTIDIAVSDIFLDESTQSDLIDHTVLITTDTVIINSDVKGVTNLTTRQIQDIYTGRITNWRQVGGPDMPIYTVIRADPNSHVTTGTHYTFERYVLGFQVITAPRQEQETGGNNLVVKDVQDTPGAIGYTDLDDALHSGYTVNIISIDGISPTDFKNIETGNYKFWSFAHMYTKGNPPYNSLTYAFMDYMYNPVINTILIEHSYLTFDDISSSAVDAHNLTPGPRPGPG